MIASLYVLDIARKTTQYRWEEIAERCGQYEAAGGESQTETFNFVYTISLIFLCVCVCHWLYTTWVQVHMGSKEYLRFPAAEE